MEIAFHLAVACDVYNGVFLCCPFSHEMPWVKFLTQLSQFLRVFLPTLPLLCKYVVILTQFDLSRYGEFNLGYTHTCILSEDSLEESNTPEKRKQENWFK